jgi:hypothetical protein
VVSLIWGTILAFMGFQLTNDIPYTNTFLYDETLYAEITIVLNNNLMNWCEGSLSARYIDVTGKNKYSNNSE